MRVMTLGQVAGVAGGVGELPSTESVLSVLRSEPGGWGKVLGSTLLRTALIMPGVWLAGGRGVRLFVGSFASSTAITLFLFFWYGARENGRATKVEVLPTAIPAGLPATTAPEAEVTLEGIFGRRRR